MPAERVSMRRVREILRLEHGCGATEPAIARSLGTVALTLERVAAAHSRWCELYRAWEGRLSPTMRQAHPAGERMFVDYAGQSLGNPELLLDRRQQQFPGVRGHLVAVESDMHRLAHHRWQTRQNPRRIVHGGRELRWPRLIRSEQPNHTRIQRPMSFPPTL